MNDVQNHQNQLQKEHLIINLGRQLGSGGRQIGRILAKEMDMAYYDKELLAMAAKESGFCEEVFKRNDEKKGFFDSMFGSIFPLVGGGESEFYLNQYANQMSNENLFRIQCDVIRKAASQGPSIFIGRCADYVLRDFSHCVNVFISADEEDRLKRIMLLTDCDEKQAEKAIRQGDKDRANFYNFYSSKEWGVASTYDLCVNSSILGIEGTAHFVRSFVEQKMGVGA